MLPAPRIHREAGVDSSARFREFLSGGEKKRVGLVDKNEETRSGPAQEASLSTSDVLRPLRTSLHCPVDALKPLACPFSMHPVVFAYADQQEQSCVRSTARRSSLNLPRASDGLDRNRRYTTNSVQLADSVEFLKDLDTAMLHRHEDEISRDNQGVALTAGSKMGKHDPVASREAPPSRSSEGGHILKHSAEEVNIKLAEMLAATDALKPAAPLSAKTGSRMLPRMAPSKVLTKVSDALGRIYSKSFSPDTLSPSKSSNQRAGKPFTGESSLSSECQALVSSMEIRLNEGVNLNKNKVQKIAGTQMLRKPVGSGGDGWPSASTSEPCLARNSSDTSGTGSKISTDCTLHLTYSSFPFDTEDDFDCNLERGILRAPPAGSSTPRLRIRKVSLDKCSLNESNGASPSRFNLARAVPIGKHKSKGPVRRLDIRSTGKRCLPGASGRPVTRVARQMRGFEGGNAKKHPSPSKGDLEQLGLAFQQYKLARALCQDDDIDELARSDVLSSTLAIKDHNQKIPGRIVRPNHAKISLAGTSPRPVPSRIPRPLGQATPKRYSQIRLAAGCRPDETFIDDTDELF